MVNQAQTADGCLVLFGTAGRPCPGDNKGAPELSAGLRIFEGSLGEWSRIEALDSLELAGAGHGSVRAGKRITRVPETAADQGRYRGAIKECRRVQERAASRGWRLVFLLEFPFSFSYSAQTRRHLDRIARDLEGLELAAAFFNAEWYSSRVIDALKMRQIAFCMMDTPACPAMPPRIDVVTARSVYIKLYGRNIKAWESGCLGSLFNYDYSTAELASWLPRIEALSGQAEEVRVIFANTRHGRAEENANRMAALWHARQNNHV